MMSKLKWAVPPGMITVAGLLLVGCAETTTSSNPETAAADAVAATLPDNVPMIAGAHLAENPQEVESDGITGWTAVAVLSPDVNQSQASAEVTKSLRAAGWTVKDTRNSAAPVITGQRRVPAGTALVVVTVTDPVPQAGPALAYRYAVRPTPESRAS